MSDILDLDIECAKKACFVNSFLGCRPAGASAVRLCGDSGQSVIVGRIIGSMHICISILYIYIDVHIFIYLSSSVSYWGFGECNYVLFGE